jgi:hypothetical protein
MLKNPTFLIIPKILKNYFEEKSIFWKFNIYANNRISVEAAKVFFSSVNSNNFANFLGKIAKLKFSNIKNLEKIKKKKRKKENPVGEFVD